MVSRLTPLVALGALLAGCQEAEPPLAATLDGPQFGHAPGYGLTGTIAFHSNRNGDFEIFVMNADGSGVIQLTQNDGIDDDDPVWSPDGKHIAFHTTRDGDEEIFAINADGTGGTQLTFNTVLPDGTPVFDAVPAWRARPLH